MVAMTPEDEALLAQVLFGGGLGQMQAPAPGVGALQPQPALLPPGQMMPARMPLPETGALYPPNMEGVTVKGIPASPVRPEPSVAMREPVNPGRPTQPMDLGTVAAAGAPQTAVATNDAPMPPSPTGGVSPAQPAGAGPAMGGLFADKEEILARLGDMMSGWAMGAGGTWQDSLAAGGKAVQVGKLTRGEEKKLAKSVNKTAEWAIKNGVDPGMAQAFVDAKDAKGLIDYTQSFMKAQAEAAQPNYMKVGEGLIVDGRDPTRVIADYRNAGGEKPTSAMQEYELAKAQGFQGSFVEFKKAMKDGGVTVNVGDGDAGDKELAKAQGAMFSSLVEDGMKAGRDAARLGRLETILAAAPQGGAGWAKQIAGEYGIKTDGLDDIQAAQAVINAIVPEQRAPGSGPMSDRDLELFKASLPRIINQPGANAMIIETIKGITEYRRKQGEIAMAVATGQMPRSEGLKQLYSMTNPLDGFNAAVSQGGAQQPAGANTTSSGVKWKIVNQ